jgi:hypothetical protein
MPMSAALVMPVLGAWESPAGRWRAGLSLVWCRGLSAWCRSVVKDLGDGGAGGGFVDEGFVGGEGGDEGLQGEVVDRAGVAAGGVVDQGGGVVGEQGVGAAGQGQVVLVMTNSSLPP